MRRERGDAGLGGDLKADDHGATGGGALDVVRRDVADGAGEDLEVDLLAADVAERVADRLYGALRVGLDDDAELLLADVLHLVEDGVEIDGLADFLEFGGLALHRELLGEFLGALLVRHHAELGAGLGHAAEAHHAHSLGGADGADLAAAVVDEAAQTAVVLVDEDDVALLERAGGDEERRGRAAAELHLRLDDVAVGAAVRVGLEFKDVGLEEDHLKEVVHPLPRVGADLAADDVAAPVLGGESFALELLADAVGLGGREVALVDRDHDLDVRLAAVLDDLAGLRHDAVVRRDDDDRDVRELGAAGAHRREGGVARGVEEGDRAAVDVDGVGADVLRDAARLAGRDL